MDDPNDPYSPSNLSWNWRFGGPKWRPFTRPIPARAARSTAAGAAAEAE